jgi:hypothetical protein
MSSPIFEPVFSVGASGHPYKMLDTWDEGAVGAQSPHRAKNRVVSRRLVDLPEMEIDRSAIAERLMWPLGVVELEIRPNAHSGFSWAGVVAEIDLLTPPDMIEGLRGDRAQQIGIDPMLTCPFAEIWAGADPRNLHLAHIALNPLPIDRTEVFLQQDGQLARAIKWVGGVQLVEPMLDGHLLRRWRHGLIV